MCGDPLSSTRTQACVAVIHAFAAIVVADVATIATRLAVIAHYYTVMCVYLFPRKSDAMRSYYINCRCVGCFFKNFNTFTLIFLDF